MRVDDALSKAREFQEGFPQGTVQGPLFWDLFVDDLIVALKERLPSTANVEVVVYADDVTVLITGPDLEDLYRQAQTTLDRLSGWERDNQAIVSMEKSSVTVFDWSPSGRGGGGKQAGTRAQRPRLLYRDRAAGPPGKQGILRHDPEPKLLGITYDERLSFESYIAELRQKLKKRASVRDALSGTSWGCSRETCTSRMYRPS